MHGPETRSIAQWSPIRFTFSIDGAIGNPYSPAEIDTWLDIETPSGRRLRHPAFYVEDYDIVVSDGHEVVRKRGTSHWEARWTPCEPGRFSWVLNVNNAGQTALAKGEFICTPDASRGFVRISDKDPNYLETSDGTFFFPVGHATRSPRDSRWDEVLAAEGEMTSAQRTFRTVRYEKWFEEMHRHGENFCTIWMTPWWLGLEWSPTAPGYGGIGRYNQIHAAQLDRVLECAERHGVYVLLYTLNHGVLSTVVDPEWYDSPYYKKGSSGVVDSPVDYFESAECRKLEERRLRYILARWGYSRALAGIVLCTEVDWVDPYNGQFASETAERSNGNAVNTVRFKPRQQAVQDWFRGLSNYVKDVDIHDHLVSVQFAKLNNGNEFWVHPEFEIVLNNCYDDEISSGEVAAQVGHRTDGLIEGIYGWSRHFSSEFKKPRMIGEWGGSAFLNARSGLETALHVGIWTQAVSDLSGVTGYWWVHEIEQSHLYPHFEALSRFLAGLDRRGQRLRSSLTGLSLRLPGSATAEDVVYVTDPVHKGLVLCGESQALAYIVHRDADSANAPIHGGQMRFAIADDRYFFIPHELSAGQYIVEFWDTFSGRILETSRIQIDAEGDESRWIRVIPFDVDIALKIRLDNSQDARSSSFQEHR